MIHDFYLEHIQPLILALRPWHAEISFHIMGFETQLTATTKLSCTVSKKSVHTVAGAHVRMIKVDRNVG